MSVVAGIVDVTADFDRSPEVAYAAWSDEKAQLTWGDPGEGWAMSFDLFSFVVGQTDVCRFGPQGGQEYVNENRYLALEPGKRIVYATSITSGTRLNFAGTVAVTFEATGEGTRMRLIEQGLYFDGQDDVEGHRSGWETMLDALGGYLHR